MDEFGCYDYKEPANSNVSDMRTSYYRAHRYLTDLRMGNKLSAKLPNKGVYVADPLLFDKLQSDYGRNYNCKYGDPNALRNPTLSMKMQHMKPLDQGRLRFLQRPLKPMSSVTKDSYAGQQLPRESVPTPIFMPQPVEATKLLIDRSVPSVAKYLDGSATTYNLSYPQRTPGALMGSIAAHDNITFWNWSEHFDPPGAAVTPAADEQMCDYASAPKCQKRRCEYQNQLKPVPHSGLITEVQENFRDPKYRKDYLAYDTNDVRPTPVHETIVPFAKSSEYALYGSGEPVLTYV